MKHSPQTDRIVSNYVHYEYIGLCSKYKRSTLHTITKLYAEDIQ